MPWLSNASYSCLFDEVVQLREKATQLTARIRSAERRTQELTLLCGMKGFAVEMTPDTPAVPAKPGVLTLTKIARGT